MTFITMYLIATIGLNDSKKTLSEGNQNGGNGALSSVIMSHRHVVIIIFYKQFKLNLLLLRTLRIKYQIDVDF